MKASIILGILCIAYPLAGHAQIYKCSNDASLVIYQDTPCNADQASITLAHAPARSPQPDGLGPTAGPRAQARSPQSGVLPLGMSDTKVLNTRGWGRPDKIIRNKVNGSWHEEWTYPLPPDGAMVLQFTNGRLAAINNVDAAAYSPQQVVESEAEQTIQE